MALSKVSTSTTSKTISAMETELEALQQQLKEELVGRLAALQSSHSELLKDQTKKQKKAQQLLDRYQLWANKHLVKPTEATGKRQQAAALALAEHDTQLDSVNKLLSQTEQDIQAIRLRLEREQHKRLIVKELTPETESTAAFEQELEGQKTQQIDVEKRAMQGEAVKQVRRGRPRKKNTTPTVVDNGNRLNAVVASAKEAVLQASEQMAPAAKAAVAPKVTKVEVVTPAPRVVSVPMGAGNHQAKVKAKAVKSIFDPVTD